MRLPVEPRHIHRLFNHGPTALITTAHAGRRNVMAAAWVMPLDFEPARFSAVVATGTFTRELLLASGECVLQAPTSAQADLTYAAGSCTGRDGDKFERLGLAAMPASTVAAPWIEGCACWIECRLLPEPEVQDRYDLFVLEALAAFADPAHFDGGRWRQQDGLPRTIHHQSGGSFFATGAALKAARP